MSQNCTKYPVLRESDAPYIAGCEQVIEAVCQIAEEMLGDQLRSVFAMGSLGYGGFVPGWSDIDIDLVVRESNLGVLKMLRLGDDIRERIHNVGHPEVDIKCYMASSLSQQCCEFEYGIANRAVMVLDSASLIRGEDIRSAVKRPTQFRLIQESHWLATKLNSASRNWWATRPLDDLAALMALPGRLLITCETGRVVGKSEAIEYLLSHHRETVPPCAWGWLIWALACRTIPIARTVPDLSMKKLRTAARELVYWVQPLTQAKYEETASAAGTD